MLICRVAIALCLVTVATVPRAVSAEEVYLQFTDLQRGPSGQFISSGLKMPPQDTSLPIVGDAEDDPVSELLRSLDDRGVANGFKGVLYDNRDRAHSALARDIFPRLTHLKYGFELQADYTDYGLAGSIRHNEIVLGNSSTAITGGPLARSLTRLAMTSPALASQSASLYRGNHIYIYPEHRDYDEVDRYPARWPYHVITQGSSGSDQPFLRAIAATLAAFREDTLGFMKKNGLVAPTLEMVLRRSLKQVSTPEDYFEGAAHRPVLEEGELSPQAHGRVCGSTWARGYTSNGKAEGSRRGLLRDCGPRGHGRETARYILRHRTDMARFRANQEHSSFG